MSDESSEDESVYSTTNVLLGYASREPTGDDITYLGGSPSWLADSKPSYDLFICKVCSKPLSQLLQLNGELPVQFPNHDRRLHILACRRKPCSRKPGSIRALRGTRHLAANAVEKKQPASTSTLISPTLGNDIFGASIGSSAKANPFSKAAPVQTDTLPSTKSNGSTQASYSSAAQTNHFAKASKPVQPWPKEPLDTNDFPRLYMDAEYESLDDSKKAESSSTHQITSTEDETNEPNGSSSSAKEDSETFESDLDKTFQKFADRLAQNPEQVLRYDYKGHPLLYSASDEVGRIFHITTPAKVSTVKRGIPHCTNCNKARIFELQLTPHAIIELENDDIGLDGMDWGTIILGVCEADCQAPAIDPGAVGYIEEWVGVQWEERKK